MAQKIGAWAFALLAALTMLHFSCTDTSQSFDLIIRGGTLIDGSGDAAFVSDIGIIGQRIVKIGRLNGTQAERIIEAKGLIVAPGFIDVHTHCDRSIASDPGAVNYVLQGVTTVIGGNCGGHPYPLSDLKEKISAQGIALNFGSLIGHNTIRRNVMGFSMEAPTAEQIEQMKALITQEMEAGGLGLSTGLSYLPGIYSRTDELVKLAAAVAPYHGVYATHLRDQGQNIRTAIEEAITIGKLNGIQVQISHIKLSEDSVWGELDRITEPVEEALKQGVTVYLDQYPYTATSSGFTSSFPSWAFEGGQERFLERLDDPEMFERIRQYILQRRLSSVRGIDKLETIYIASCRAEPGFQGKNLREILAERGEDTSIDNAARLIIEIQKRGGAQGVFFQMDEADVENLMGLEYVMHASDGGIQTPGQGVPHPRNYGTFPRIIARYVRERGVLKLDEAIRKMTSLPAEAFQITDRGLLKEDFYADITIFDFQQFADQATFEDPHQFSRGLNYVIVNGEIVVEQNQPTGNLPGKMILGQAAEPHE